MPLFVFLAVVSLLGGVAELTAATSGVGGIAAACFFLIAGRCYQASEQHKALIASLRRLPQAPAPEKVPNAPPPVLHSATDEIACSNCGTTTRRGPAKCSTCGASLRGAVAI
jgi:hypothetical protein